MFLCIVVSYNLIFSEIYFLPQKKVSKGIPFGVFLSFLKNIFDFAEILVIAHYYI